jgi:hypothetical protein
VGTLLDAPGLILKFEGLVILPELLGEALVTPGGVRTEYALATSVPANRTQSPSDFPFLLRVAALACTGQCEISISTLDEQRVFAAIVAAEPARPWVTAVRWRSWSRLTVSNGRAAMFSLRTEIDPAALMALRATPASDCWNASSDHASRLEAPIFESRGVR